MSYNNQPPRPSPQEPSPQRIQPDDRFRSAPTNAERVVIQLVNAEIDLGNTAQSLVGSVAQQLGIPWKEIVDQTSGPRLLHVPKFPTLSSLPSKSMADMMIDKYFTYVNCFQPLLDYDVVQQE